MKINKKLFWIPIYGLAYLIDKGRNEGFFTRIENMKMPEMFLCCLMHAVSIVGVLIYFAIKLK